MTASGGGNPGGMSLEQLVDRLELTDEQKVLLRSRWLDQMHWMSVRARVSRRRHLLLRWIIAIGGVILPSLVSFSLGAGQSEPLRWITFGVSLVVALLATTEEVFHFGDTWHHYRRTAELLKSAGWQFVQLTGPYARWPDHASALPAFTRRVEEILAENVDEYFGRVVAEDTRSGTATNVG
jgi:hypothetical protein